MRRREIGATATVTIGREDVLIDCAGSDPVP
jgi:hypothetical protein